MFRASLFAAAVLVCAPFTSAARLPGGSPTDLSTFSTGVGTRAVPASEDFETFTLGTAAQNGWTNNFSADFAITSTTPIQGQKSWRHTSDGSNVADTSASPTFAGYYGFFASAVRINSLGNGTETNQWIPLGDAAATGGGTYYNTRIQFNPDHTISALQVSGATGVFAPTTGTWANGETFQIASETRADGSIRVYKNGGLIFTGIELGFALTGTAGKTIAWNSFHDDVTNSTGSTMTVDSFTNNVPEPATLGMIGLASLGLTIRRRRRGTK